jgi:hypothetical protein
VSPTDAMNRALTEKNHREYAAVIQKLAKLKQQNKLLLSHNESGIDSYLKSFTEVRSASLIEIMHKYLCVLLHHLLKAGEQTDIGQSW